MSDAELPIVFTYGGAGGPSIAVSVAQDVMTAWGTFSSGTTPGGKMLVWSEFFESLQSAGLDSCALEREIQEAMFRFNTGHPPAETVVIAKGRAPQAERPAYLRLEPRFFSHHFTDQGGAQVDFKQYSPYVIVKKGELLASGIMPRLGVSGINVRGVEIAAGRREIKHLKPGPHTLFAHGKVFSQIAGRVTVEGDVFDVSDLLELDAGVGYSTGNLTFPGSVVVKGVVADGFRLVAGGSITVKGPLDASEVLCHGDLQCEGGIIGRKPGLVRSGGNIRALYVEHCQVEALGTISISKALLHASVYTNGDLTLDEGGRIVASSLWVKGNLSCGQLGGENGPVHLVAGVDFVVQRKLEGLRVKHEALEDEILKEKAKNQTTAAEKTAALEALVAEINTLTPQLFANAATEVRVSHKVFEGSVIEMGFASLTVSKPLKGQLFSLSSDGKSILAAPLVTSTKDGKDKAPEPTV